MLLPNRHGNTSDYRYGFNGKEMDSEIKGEGVQYDYGFRVYDARLGKFLSQDPLFKSFPWYTPYQFAGNKPIIAIDLDGLEEYFYWNAIQDEVGKAKLDLVPGWFLYADKSKFPNLSQYGLYKSKEEAIDAKIKLDRQIESDRYIASFKASEKAYNEYRRLQNPLVLTYEFSPFGSASSAIDNFQNGEYGWGTLDLAFSFTEIRSIINPKAFSSFRWSSIGKLPVQEIAQKQIKELIPIIERIYKSRNRPSFREGIIDEVWEKSKNAQGEVRDPNTGELLTWDKTKSRFDQWHMGHLPDEEWRILRQQYIEGKITWEQVLDTYNNPNKYWPESPKSNMSGQFEGTTMPRQ